MLPTYNERDNIADLVSELLTIRNLRVLIVDDHSPDGTGDVADELAARHEGRVGVLHRTEARGLGRSYIDGLQQALLTDASVIVQIDADWSHDPTYLPGMIDATVEADLVIGSRYIRGVSVVNWPLHRILLSSLANHYVRTITGLTIRDCTSGYRCWRREALETINQDNIASDGYAFLVELLFEAAQQGRRVIELPIIFIERRAGTSKVSKRVLAESLLIPWRLALSRAISRCQWRRAAPLRNRRERPLGGQPGVGEPHPRGDASSESRREQDGDA